MRIALRIASYLLLAAMLAFCVFGAWFLYMWGFSPFGILPILIVGGMICAGIIAVVHLLTPRKPPA